MMIRFLILSLAAILCMSGCNRATKENQMETLAPSEQQTGEMIATLRAAYAAFNQGDIDAAVASFDSDIEWSEPQGFPGGGTYHGRVGAKRYLTQSRAAWAEVNSDPERFIISGNRIVVFVHARVRPKDGSEFHDVNLADVYTFRNGKAIKMQAFADRQEALRWAGVEDLKR
jgi:ketosteroid isomerase-like protein